MTERPPDQPGRPSPEAPEKPPRPDYSPPPGLAYKNTPNAEKYILEADEMRRRQMRSALLHGSRRTWREHRRVWPAVVVGLIIIGVIVAGLAVNYAFRETKRNQEEQQREQEQRGQPSAPVTPGPSGTPGSAPPTPR